MGMANSTHVLHDVHSWFARGLWLALLLSFAPGSRGNGAAAWSSLAYDQPAPGEPLVLAEPRTSSTRDWGVQFGVAVISQNNVGQIFAGEPAEGAAAGEIYLLTLSRTVHRFQIRVGGLSLTPEVEPYVTLGLVDESERAPFPDYNGGVAIRWVDFPWNKWIKTTLFVGIGLSYSAHIYTVDYERHPGEERSHLKFDWPIQITFAIPRWPQHQFVLFNDHQSGGHIFDEGGVNSLGIGYRFEF
jgi:hypothetical protein